MLDRLLGRESVVVDLGAHQGEFAHGMIERFGCKVVAAEPVETLYREIQPNALLNLLPVAVGGKNQSIEINVFERRCASVLGSIKSGEPQIKQVAEMVTLAELKRRAGITGIDVLKIDIEGAEIDLLGSCSDDELKTVKQMTVEFHEFLYPEQAKPVAEILERMRRLGFWVLPFSLDNTNVLFLNKSTRVGPAEVAFLRTFVRFGKGIARRARRTLHPPN
jgi:FkbM family methyltransferase